MVFPLVVDDLEHDPALALPHEVGADEVFLCLILLRELLEQDFFERLSLEAGEFAWLDLVAELAENVVAEAVRSQVSG